MSEILLTDSNVSDSQEVLETAPVEAESTESQNESSVWDEDYDVNAGKPPVDRGSDKSDETPVLEDKPVENNNEYQTEGLGTLDKPLVVKVKGKIYDLTDMDQIRGLVEKGFIATQKLQEVAEMKRELEKQQNPDMTDADIEQKEVNDELESVAQEILNGSNADEMREIIGGMPQTSIDEFKNSPKMLKGLQHDVQSGFAMAIMPKVNHMMNIDGMSFIEAYMAAGKEYHDNDATNSVKAEQKQNNMELLVSGKSGGSAVMDSKPLDVWDMSDEDYRALNGTIRH